MDAVVTFFHLYDKTKSNVIWSAFVIGAPPRATLIKRLFSFTLVWTWCVFFSEDWKKMYIAVPRGLMMWYKDIFWIHKVGGCDTTYSPYFYKAICMSLGHYHNLRFGCRIWMLFTCGIYLYNMLLMFPF